MHRSLSWLRKCQETLKNGNGQTKRNAICAPAPCRPCVRYTQFSCSAIKGRERKKKESINRFCDFSGLLCSCASERACLRSFFVWNFSLCWTLYTSSRLKLARKKYSWPFAMPALAFVLETRRRATIHIACGGQRGRCQWKARRRDSLTLFWQWPNICMYVIDNFDIYAFCLHDSNAMATSRPLTTTISGERSGTDHLASLGNWP